MEWNEGQYKISNDKKIGFIKDKDTFMYIIS